MDTDLVHGKLQLTFAVGRRGTVAPPVSSRRMLLSPFTSLCTTSAAVAVPISAPSGVIRVQTRASAPSFGMGCVLQDTSLRVCYRVASRGYEGTLLVSAGAEQQHDWRVTSDTSRKQHVQVRVMAGDDAPTPSPHLSRVLSWVRCGTKGYTRKVVSPDETPPKPRVVNVLPESSSSGDGLGPARISSSVVARWRSSLGDAWSSIANCSRGLLPVPAIGHVRTRDEWHHGELTPRRQHSGHPTHARHLPESMPRYASRHCTVPVPPPSQSSCL